ncbi:unnamed protein product [Caenorhabditis nigoni]
MKHVGVTGVPMSEPKHGKRERRQMHTKTLSLFTLSIMIHMPIHYTSSLELHQSITSIRRLRRIQNFSIVRN